MMNDLAGLAEITARALRLARGELTDAPVVAAGSVPSWYGSEHPFDAWMRMWRMSPMHEAFFEAGAIGWASRD